MSINVKIKKPKLTDYQREALYCKERFSIVEACTKSGKTYSHMWWLFEAAMGKNPSLPKITPGAEFWWVAPVSGQAEIAYKRLRRKVSGAIGFQCFDSKGNQRIILPNGAVIVFKSADRPDSLYGEDVWAMVFDEFTRAKLVAWTALRSTLTATRGPAKFIGNYKGDANWGHILGKKAKVDERYRYTKWTAPMAVAAGILDAQEVDEARRDLSTADFQMLYMAEGGSSADTLYSTDDIAGLWTNTFVEKDIQKQKDLFEKGQSDKPVQKYISADIALHGSDRFVMGYFEGLALMEIIVIDKCDADEVTQAIKGLAETKGVQRKNIVYDADGLGAFLKGYLKGAIPFHNGGAPVADDSKTKIEYQNLKAQCAYMLSKKLPEMFIKSDEHEMAISEELAATKKRMSGEHKHSISKKADVKEIIGRSPDLFDMLSMRMRFELKRYTGEYDIF